MSPISALLPNHVAGLLVITKQMYRFNYVHTNIYTFDYVQPNAVTTLAVGIKKIKENLEIVYPCTPHEI